MAAANGTAGKQKAANIKYSLKVDYLAKLSQKGFNKELNSYLTCSRANDTEFINVHNEKEKWHKLMPIIYRHLPLINCIYLSRKYENVSSKL